jgi:hypothetical protein
MMLSLVCETSGSMGEWGKLLIARAVARTIEQYLRLGYGQAKLQVVAWSDGIHVIDWHSDQEFPSELMVPAGSSRAKPLIDHFGNDPDGRILLLTDGFWPEADSKDIKRWKERLRPDTLRVIKIGADANPQLKGNDVFTVEDLFAALDGWTEGGTT